MRQNDTRRASGVVAPRDILVALALLTRLPLPHLPDHAFARQARAAWAFPLVGALVGLAAVAVGTGALRLGLPAAGAAGLALLAQVLMTGAMHEDGLADSADGLFGGWTRARRLEIMKDSHIGSYGVLALILFTGLRWVALTGLLMDGIGAVVAAAILSRALLPGLMTALPPARASGLSHGVGRPGRTCTAIALGLGIGLAVLTAGAAALVGPLALALVAVGALAVLAKTRIGGQTGDILGAAQQVGETALLLGFLALAG